MSERVLRVADFSARTSETRPTVIELEGKGKHLAMGLRVEHGGKEYELTLIPQWHAWQRVRITVENITAEEPA
mgnify:FL=1